MTPNVRAITLQTLIILVASLLAVGCDAPPATPASAAATKAPTAGAAPTAIAPTKAEATTATQTPPGNDLALNPYVDPKGYFKITPPKGWKTDEYPTDSRGKVAFSKTEGSQLVEIRVLVQVTQVTDFQEFARKLKSNVANLGVQAEWQVTMFSGLPSVRSTMTVSAQGITNKFMNLRFLDGNIYHDLQFASPPALFDKYQDLVSRVVASYQIVKRPSGGDDSALAKRQQAEKYLRLAQIAIELGDKKNAAVYVAEGLKIDPENKELQKLRDTLK